MFTTSAVTNYSQSRFSNKGDKKFCGVCKNAGKPATLYESHFTRSIPGPKGIVVCPTILTAVCNTCGKSGHFTNSKQCPNNRSDLKDNTRMTSVKSQASKGSHATNIYSVLEDFDHELPVVKRQKVGGSAASTCAPVASYPTAATCPTAIPCATAATCAISEEIKTLAPGGVSFAAMLKKPAPKPVEPSSYSRFKISQKLQETIDNRFYTNIHSDKSRMLQFRTSWISDDESDDDIDNNTAW